MSAYSIKVIGKVQGVFFRVSTQEKARSLGIRGWVRNEPDRSVLIHAEGEGEPLRELIDWCHRGPVQAEVQDVQMNDIAEEGFSDFSIHR